MLGRSACTCATTAWLLLGGCSGEPTRRAPGTEAREALSFQPSGVPAERRRRHTATLLPSGRVLLLGGKPPADSSSELWDALADLHEPGPPPPVAIHDHTATLLRDGSVLIVGGYSDGGVPSAAAFRYEPGSNGFVTDAPAPTARAEHTATLLPDGSVLVAGGMGAASTLVADAVIFDPQSSADPWSTAGSLATARRGHTATLLADGRVLVVGGEDGSGQPLGSTEIWDPAGGGFSAGPPLPISRTLHVATALADGRVLVAFGTGAGVNTERSSAELFDPAAAGGAGAFVATPDAAEARAAPSAALLPGGDVLFVGGRRNLGYVAESEIFDATALVFRPAGPSEELRTEHTATLLPTGKLLIAGGNYSLGPPPPDELFDFQAGGTAGAFATSPGSMATGRTDHRVALMPDGRVLVTGGSVAGAAVSSAEIFDPATGTFAPTAPLSVPRRGHSVTLLATGKLLVAGGDDGSAEHSSAELFDPAASGGAGAFVPAGTMSAARSGHTAIGLPSGAVLLAGGVAGGAALATSELYDPTSGSFAAGPPLTEKRAMHTASLLADGRVLLAGGGMPLGPITLSSSEIWDPRGGAGFAAGPNLLEPRRNHSATPLANGHVLLVGGGTGGSGSSTAELFDPALGAFRPAASASVARDSHGAIALPSGDVLVVGDSSAVAEIFDPHGGGGEGSFSVAASLARVRDRGAALLLASGEVAVIGGLDKPTVLADAELWNPWCEASLGCRSLAGRRPSIASVPASVVASGTATVSGSGFTPSLDASGGTTAASPTRHPAALWMPPGGPPVLGTFTSFGATSAEWQVPASVRAGPGWLHAVVDGVPSLGVFTAIVPRAEGAACAAAEACAGGFCVDGVCCESACDASCEACSVAAGGASDGACSALAPSSGVEDCRLDDGAACASAAECTSGHCADGVCCNLPCDAACEACDLPGGAGTCAPVPAGPPRAGHPACAGTEPPCAGSCDGQSRACSYPPASTPCGPGSCADGTAHQRHCDGLGACGPTVATDCGKYACDAEACRTSCASDADCDPDFACETGTGDCLSRLAECDGDHTLVGALGTEDCAPYRCTEAGGCLSDCESSADCVAGHACSADGACVEPAAAQAGDDDAGCACRAGRRGAGAGTLAGLALLVFAARRRRGTRGPA